MAHVLIVEDSASAAQLVTAALRSAGHQTSVAGTGAAALDMARAVGPDVILLDLGLPDGDGAGLCPELAEACDAHIVVLTARDDELDKVLALRTGADDFLTKPVPPRELCARVEAIVRRRRGTGPERLSVGDTVLDRDAHEVQVRGRSCPLTPTEFGILERLLDPPGRVCSREQLAEGAWGHHDRADLRAINVHVGNLRRKLRGGTARIEAVRGVGYRVTAGS